jgi:hypothetical protein
LLTVSVPGRRTGPGAPRLRALLSSRRLLVAIALVVVMAVAGVLVAHYVVRVDQWRVMRDELLYLELARSTAHSFSPNPVVHGQHVAIFSILYSLIISPFAGALDAPTAFQVIRIVNVVLMVSTAIPAYLLAREGTSSRVAGVVAAGLSVLVPWMGQSMTLMTEVAGYPFFTWAVFAMTRAVAAPSRWRDIVALAAIAVACLARTQFLILIIAFPVAVLVHELGRRIGADGVRNVRSVVVGGTRAAVRGHLIVVAIGLIGVLLLAFRSRTILGDYAVTTSQGSVIPPGLPGSALEHLAYIAVGIGALPLVFALAFVLATLGRAVDARPHALASVCLVVVVLVTFAVSSFDLRFTSLGRTVQERYLFYICPPIFAAAVAWLAQPRRSRAPIVVAAIASVAVVLSQSYKPHPEATIEGFASPNRYSFAVIDGRLRQLEGHIGLQSLGPAVAIALGCVVLAALAWFALSRGKARLTVALFAIVMTAFLAAQLRYVLPRVVVDHNRFAGLVIGQPSGKRDWVDDRVSGNAAAVESTINSRAGQPVTDTFLDSAVWWDLEFWNKSVDRVYEYGSTNVLPLAPVQYMTLDFATGAMHVGGPTPPPNLVLAASETRWAPESRGAPEQHGDLTLYHTPLPYRAAWADQGVDGDGWTQEGRPMVLRLYARRGAGAERWNVRMLMRGGPDGSARPYTLTGDGLRRRGVASNPARNLRFERCVLAGGHADVTLRVKGGTRVGPRVLGLQLLALQAASTGRPCSPAGG